MSAYPLLTFSVVSGNTDLPLTTIGVSGAFTMPHMVRSSDFFVSVSKSPVVYPLAGFDIGGNDVLMFVRLRRLIVGRGALFPPFLCSNPKTTRFLMFRIYTTSRFLRLRHRLLSSLSNLAGHTAATVALGVLLLLPALFFGEVL